ncbi:MAG: hypothetical protein EOO71_28790, partial [Myxococcaceae bacterium]
MNLKPLSRAVLTAALATGLSATSALAVTPVTPLHESPPVAPRQVVPEPTMNLKPLSRAVLTARERGFRFM